MSDEFIEDDFIEENEGAASNRPFLLAVGALVTLFILAAICALVVINMRGNAVTNSTEVAAIETQNAITIVTNTAVAQFIAQTNTAQAMPTNTPAAAVTNTNTPTAASVTAAVTSTPVIEGGAVGTAVGEGEGEEGTAGEVGTTIAMTGTVTSAAGTIVIGGDNGDNGTGGTTGTGGTAVAGGSGDSTGTGGVALTRTAVPAATTSAQAGSQTGALPQTGLEIWVIALVGLLLVAVVIVVHRLRAG